MEDINMTEEEILLKLVRDLCTILTYVLMLFRNDAKMQNLNQFLDMKCTNEPADTQQKNGETKPYQHKTEHHHEQKVEIKQNESKNYSDIDQNMLLLAENSIQIRLKVLAMELNVVKAFYDKELIQNANDSLNKITLNMLTEMSALNTLINNNYSEMAKEKLLNIEKLCVELMKKVKNVIKKKAVKKEMKSVVHTDIPNYKSTVTVKGTKEDVVSCILKADKAFDSENFDKAERLLLKAERMFSTKNARALLNRVRVARDAKGTPEFTEKSTESELSTVTVEKKPILDKASALECLNVFQKAFAEGNLDKAERMLMKAKRIDPLLHVDAELQLVKAEIEKAKRECETASGFNNSRKTDCQNTTPFGLKSVASNILKTAHEHEQAVSGSDQHFAAEYLYKAKKAYDAGSFSEVEQHLNTAKKYDPSLNLELYFTECRDKNHSTNPTIQSSWDDDKLREIDSLVK